MSKHEKILQKLCRRPLPQDLSWRELEKLLKGFGFVKRQGRGSRVKFFIKGDSLSVIDLHEPHPEPEVDRAALADVYTKLVEMGFINE